MWFLQYQAQNVKTGLIVDMQQDLNINDRRKKQKARDRANKILAELKGKKFIKILSSSIIWI